MIFLAFLAAFVAVFSGGFLCAVALLARDEDDPIVTHERKRRALCALYDPEVR